MTISYAFSEFETIKYIPRRQLYKAFQRACDRWSKVIPVTFVEAKTIESANITIRFIALWCKGESLAYCYMCGKQAGVNFDATTKWTVKQSLFSDTFDSNTYNFESTAVHEIGHLLGMRHSPNMNSVMYRTSLGKMNLSREDVEKIREPIHLSPVPTVSPATSTAEMRYMVMM
ncbi:hypothetical protein J5N97_026519 [Dioscorea zingiberensis]|uniref:Peptidase metallopeptidase domain-containing protein n=1 Tax=Dioscorea zingiberensis TaxID=325984 RepID=A0A9D5C2G4_9LILI|nr:hypothetical protein J5N97_026519 [Dioscorea zingiberensis]